MVPDSIFYRILRTTIAHPPGKRNRGEDSILAPAGMTRCLDAGLAQPVTLMTSIIPFIACGTPVPAVGKKQSAA